MEVVEIEILGRRYSLRSERPAAHLKAVGVFVDQKLREVAGGDAAAVKKDHAILAALNIASELFMERELLEEVTDSVDGALADALQLVEDVLAGDQAAD